MSAATAKLLEMVGTLPREERETFLDELWAREKEAFELRRREDEADSAAADQALARNERVSWETLKTELDEVHGLR